MNERTVFLTALEKEDSADRSAYLDAACAGDGALRARVEALLRAHEEDGEFLDVPAVEQLSGGNAPKAPSGDTQEAATAQGKDGDALDFLAPSDKPDVLGRLGHYEIQEIIGRGGMGVVLKAFDEQLHRVVAIKVMAAQLATNATARKRFTREAQAAVSHDHIVTIHAVEEDSQLPYLVMQYVAGMSLQQRLNRDGPLELQEILRIGMQTAAGLAAAHAQGLVHRDIKPANILLENGVERVRITDFGLARAASEASLTQSGVVAGTPQYMSPEQAEGKLIDQRTDLFSLGSVLYAMCTGRAPFRASGSMAVLKRVCEETPTPIRETNPEIPDWLVAIIDKLHAKDPAERFQTAAEVAQLLGQHLAHVQHPSVAPLPTRVARPEQREGREVLARDSTPFEDSGRATRRTRRWAVAAAMLLFLIAGLSLTEATGVSNLRATVIRIFTPHGTLVVETDDPAVKVTVEGDDGLVITGAGLEEIRLRPGSYRVQADRDGKPVLLDKNLVEVARGGRAIVKVKLEAPTAATAAKAEKGAFVLLAAGKERTFDTLAEAVQRASDGDTIEVRGNGPFVSPPIRIQGTALTIRAGAGFRPVIKLSPEAVPDKGGPFLATNAALVLEGLELHRAPPESGGWTVVRIDGAPLRAANCRFRAGIFAQHSPVCMFRNCEFLHGSFNGLHRSGARVSVDNCVYSTEWSAIGFSYEDPAALRDISFQIARSTFVGLVTFWVPLHGPLPEASQPFRLEVSRCVFACPSALDCGAASDKVAMLGPAEAEVMLLRRLQWRGERNLFASGSMSVRWSGGFKQQPPHGPKSLEEWKRFWKTTEADSLEGPVRYKGGNLFARTEKSLDQLTPDDFRLRPDSAGYKAGKDGKDVGADVDLVGPGPAYDRWKKTPDYQQWLKDTKQATKAETPKAEPQAFVLLGGKGVEERKFDTLAEAVQRASDGDTIEVRGNGPFVSMPISISPGRALIIRAAEGYRPVIRAGPDEKGPFLLTTRGFLVLEGLDLQWVDAKPYDRRDGGNDCLVVSTGPTSRLHVANCRFLMIRREGPHSGMLCIGAWSTPFCHLRNCQMGIAGHGNTVMGTNLGFLGNPQSKLIVDNCLFAPGVSLNPSDAETMTVVLNRSTLLGWPSSSLQLQLSKKIEPPLAKKGARPLQLETSGNIFHGSMVFTQGSVFLPGKSPQRKRSRAAADKVG